MLVYAEREICPARSASSGLVEEEFEMLLGGVFFVNKAFANSNSSKKIFPCR